MPGLLRQPREFRNRREAQLRGNRGAVQLNRAFVDAEIGGDLFVEPPCTT
jgi:hypothetical protein